LSVADCINMTRTRTLRYNYSFIDKLQADILTFCEKKNKTECVGLHDRFFVMCQGYSKNNFTACLHLRPQNHLAV